jgi:DNA-binding CsgD family transcriptional regulator
MVMFRDLVLLNALCLYTSVTVYIAFFAAMAPVSGQTELAGLNLFFMLSTAVGILSFGVFRNRFPDFPLRHAFLAALGVNGISIAALAVILFTGKGFSLCYAGLFLFAASNGYLTGNLFYRISCYIPTARQGLCIGSFLACSHFFMFLSDSLVKAFGIPQNYSLCFPFPVLAIMGIILLRKEPKETNHTTPAPNLLIRRHAPLFLIAAALLSLTVGFSDSLFLTRHAESAEWFRYTRFANVGGFLLAGWLADTYPVYLPLTALIAKTVSLGFCVFWLEGGNVGLSNIADCFFTTFLIVFLIWLFITLASHVSRSELWAGLGRVIELPCGALGAMLGVILLQHLPVSLTFLVYVIMLMLSAALFYQALLVWHKNSNRPVILATVNRVAQVHAGFVTIEPHPPVQVQSDYITPAIANTTVEPLPTVLDPTFNITPEQMDELLLKFKAFYHFTRRETEILRELLKEQSIAEISETLIVTPRTVKYHISNLFQKTGAKTQKDLKRILRKQKKRFDSGQDVISPDKEE